MMTVDQTDHRPTIGGSMQRGTKLALVGIAALTIAGAGTGIAIASGAGDDDSTETPISGGALGKASAVALDHTGGGTVTETEVGDEEGYYEVEVTLDDGSQVDVHLDESFNVIDQEADGRDDD
jgi:uncharacterized membrane protein YkoI